MIHACNDTHRPHPLSAILQRQLPLPIHLAPAIRGRAHLAVGKAQLQPRARLHRAGAGQRMAGRIGHQRVAALQHRQRRHRFQPRRRCPPAAPAPRAMPRAAARRSAGPACDSPGCGCPPPTGAGRRPACARTDPACDRRVATRLGNARTSRTPRSCTRSRQARIIAGRSGSRRSTATRAVRRLSTRLGSASTSRSAAVVQPLPRGAEQCRQVRQAALGARQPQAAVLRHAVQAADQPRGLVLQVGHQVGPRRHRQFGRRGGGGRAAVGGEIDQRGVGLVADRGDQRDAAGGGGADDDLLVERHQVFQAAAAAGDDQHVRPRHRARRPAARRSRRWRRRCARPRPRPAPAPARAAACEESGGRAWCGCPGSPRRARC